MEPKEMNKSLEPLKFLIGTWQSIAANGRYLPRVQPFVYCEQLVFESIGQPVLNYKATSWHTVDKFPMHLESGFLKIKPGTDRVSFLISHNFGLTTIEEGNIIDGKIRLKSTNIGRSAFSVEPAVKAIERNITLLDNGKLEVIIYMETSESPMAEHLAVIYEKL